MRNLTISAFFTVLVSFFSAPSLFGADSLVVADFEYGNACNRIGIYWYFWCDSLSTINGSYETSGSASSGYAGAMDFNIKGTAYPYASMGFYFDNAGAPVNLTGADSVRFDIKANKSMHVLFLVLQLTNNKYNSFYADITVPTSWATKTVKLSVGTGGLTQLSGSDPFSKNKLTGLNWSYTEEQTSGSTGKVWIDNIRIFGNPSGLHAPFAPFVAGVSMNDPVSPTVTWYRSEGATSYGLQVSSDTFITNVVNLSGISDTMHTVTGLTSEKLYYWRVNATAGSNTSRWSWIGYFMITTVSYDGNGSDGGTVPSSANYIQGAKVTVSGNTGNLTKSGCVFAGWNTAADGSGTGYTAGDTFSMGTSDVTLYAKWTSNPTYSVAYNGNGNTSGSAPADPNNYQQGATVTVLGNTGSLVETGSTFSGWNTAADGGGTSFAAGGKFAMDSANVTLYAQWPLNKYTLTIKRARGQNPMEKISDTVVTHGDTTQITADSVEGYTFVHWLVTGGKVLLLDSTELTCRIILSNGKAEVTAYYTIIMSANNALKKIPTTFGLSCNGKKGTIAFAIPQVAGFSSIPVSIRLFDVKGQLLGVIIDRTVSPGYYTAKIGKQVKMATAMVICRMESVGYRSVAKIIVK